MSSKKIKVLVTREYKVSLHDGITFGEIKKELFADIKRGVSLICGGGYYGFEQGKITEIKEADDERD